jgi:hypothetical protein
MPFKKSKPLLLGKLRVRLSTVAPGTTWTVALPMLAGRRNGGQHTATAHLSMRVGVQLHLLMVDHGCVWGSITSCCMYELLGHALCAGERPSTIVLANAGRLPQP